MALGCAHTHAYQHESDFKKPNACQPVAGAYLV